MQLLGPDGQPLRSDAVGIMLPAGVADADADADENDIAEILAGALLALEAAGAVGTIKVNARLTWDLIGSLQLALKHPDYPADLRPGVEAFVREGLIDSLCDLVEQVCGREQATIVQAIADLGFEGSDEVAP